MRLTYANVMSTVAVFLALGGAGAFAASQLAKKSVGTAQLKKNAVTSAKLKKNAVTGPKIKAGAVGFADLGAGSNVIARSTTGPLGELTEFPYRSGFNPPISFTASAGVAYIALIETRSSLVRSGDSSCDASVIPVLNGQLLSHAEPGGMEVHSGNKSGEEAPVPITSSAVPLGLGGGAQELTLEIHGDGDCAKDKSTLTVNVAVIQLK